MDPGETVLQRGATALVRIGAVGMGGLHSPPLRRLQIIAGDRVASSQSARFFSSRNDAQNLCPEWQSPAKASPVNFILNLNEICLFHMN